MNPLCSHIKGQRRQRPAFGLLQGLATGGFFQQEPGLLVSGLDAPVAGSATHSSRGAHLAGCGRKELLERDLQWGEGSRSECQSDRPYRQSGDKALEGDTWLMGRTREVLLGASLSFLPFLSSFSLFSPD